jgi:hypothetical protein
MKNNLENIWLKTAKHKPCDINDTMPLDVIVRQTKHTHIDPRIIIIENDLVDLDII